LFKIYIVILPLNPLKGTSVSEKTENNYGLSHLESPLGDLRGNQGANLVELYQ
jgi:hypothetical protein